MHDSSSQPKLRELHCNGTVDAESSQKGLYKAGRQPERLLFSLSNARVDVVEDPFGPVSRTWFRNWDRT